MAIGAQGDVVWSQSYAGDVFSRVRSTRDGGSVLAGSITRDAPDFYVARMDAEARVRWQRATDDYFKSSSEEANARGDAPEERDGQH